MPIKWKSSDRLKPELVLKEIESVRTVSPQGGVSYAGFGFQEHLPTLYSMLVFPSAADEVGSESLVWRALSRAGSELTPSAFLKALNEALDERLAVRETEYSALTSISLDPEGIPRTLKLVGAEIRLCGRSYPPTFQSREALLDKHKLKTPQTPDTYCRVLVKLRAKSDAVAFHRATRALDLIRALLSLMANPQMQLSFTGSQPFEPINVIRLGSRHTVHLPNGSSSRDGIWYEPNFAPTNAFKFTEAKIVVRNLRWALRRIQGSAFQEVLISALLRYVRALDHSDPNTSFLRLWGALETLTTPDVADYDRLIRRTSFLFREHEYHRQVLEHLRIQRNANAHHGEESENSRIHCFQLQMYFVNAIWHYIRNAVNFASLADANDFLDLPPQPEVLARRLASIKKAIRFISPRDA